LISCQQVDPAEVLLLPTPTAAPTVAATIEKMPATVADFEAFRVAVEEARLTDRADLVNDFLAQVEQIPIAEGNRAIFLYRGDANQVFLTGDMNNWTPGVEDVFTRVIGSNLWWLSAEYEPDARLDYQIVVNGETQLDPLNSHTALSETDFKSELAMPAYQLPPELVPSGVTYPAGKLSDHTLDSAFLGETRTYFVYEPASQLIGAPLPTLYVHDGTNFLNIVDMTELLDRMIAEREIPPMLVVFIPPIDRQNEYNRNAVYTNFVASELVPAVRDQYNADPDPAHTGMLGTALSAVAALQLALDRPDIFGLVALQSGPFGMDDAAIVNELSLMQPLPLQFFIRVGRYETAVGGDSAENDILAANRRLVAFLGEKGYEYDYAEYPEGHSWGFWRTQIGDALRFLYD
jgi:enterochelin esterase family protein